MYLVINKCVTAVKVSDFTGHYLRNRSTLDIGVLGYIGILQHKEHPPEVWHIPPGTPCIYLFDVKFTEDDLKKIKTCWILGDWCVKVYFNTFLFVCVN